MVQNLTHFEKFSKCVIFSKCIATLPPIQKGKSRSRGRFSWQGNPNHIQKSYQQSISKMNKNGVISFQFEITENWYSTRLELVLGFLFAIVFIGWDRGKQFGRFCENQTLQDMWCKFMENSQILELKKNICFCIKKTQTTFLTYDSKVQR